MFLSQLQGTGEPRSLVRKELGDTAELLRGSDFKLVTDQVQWKPLEQQDRLILA